MISISSSCSSVAVPSKASAAPIKTGTPAPPPCARNPFRSLCPFWVPTAVNTCGSKSSRRRSSSVIPSEFCSSSSSVRLRADLLGAPPLCKDDTLPLRRACRRTLPPVAAATATVVEVSGLRSLRGRAATATRGESRTALASGSSSSSLSLTCSSTIRGRVAVRNGGRILRGEGAGSGDRGGRLSNALCADIPRLRRGGVGGTGVALSRSESGGGGARSASSASSCPCTTIAGT
jgi:hypothetical protein